MKFGFVSTPVIGHLNPMTALARKLQSRGDEVVFIGLPDVEPIVRAANLNFVPFCEKEYPLGSVAKGYAPLAKLHGFDVVEHSARARSKVMSPDFRIQNLFGIELGGAPCLSISL